MGNGASGAGVDRNRMVADLARCELLADASPEDLWRLADLLTPVSAAAGVVLVAPGDATDGFLFVTRGRVGVAADHEPPGRKEFVVPEGSVVGELALLGRAACHRDGPDRGSLPDGREACRSAAARYPRRPVAGDPTGPSPPRGRPRAGAAASAERPDRVPDA
jgi:CRP-like cAMP-binding protein